MLLFNQTFQTGTKRPTTVPQPSSNNVTIWLKKLKVFLLIHTILMLSNSMNIIISHLTHFSMQFAYSVPQILVTSIETRVSGLLLCDNFY